MKTKAEYQKEYRERKKVNDPNYLARERRRSEKNRKPAAKLEVNELERVRQNSRERSRKYRERKQQIKENAQQSSSNGVSSSTFLRFTMKGPSKQASKRKRSKALSKAHIKIKRLENDLKQSNKKTWKLQKRISRKKNYSQHDAQSRSSSTPATPRTAARNILQSSGIKPKAAKKVFQELVKGRAILKEIQIANQNNDRYGKRIIASCIGGKVVKKYRCQSYLFRKTMINRRQLAAGGKLTKRIKDSRLLMMKKHTEMCIHEFYHRDEISRVLPGKNDGIKINGAEDKVQKRVLNDYLTNIYDQFTVANAEIKISLSGFCKLRPKNIMKCNLLSRKTCLCLKHQNMSLKLASLKANGISITPHPDVVSRTITADQLRITLDNLSDKEYSYEVWKQQVLDGRKRMSLVKEVVSRAQYIELISEEYLQFLEHVHRVNEQYLYVEKKKLNLRDGEVLIQMDFAENWTCQASNEVVQSAYWNCSQVTLHPIVAYYKKEAVLHHVNIIFISDEISHNTKAVLAIIKKLIPELREKIPHFNRVVYITDSPTSQYRNQFIFHILIVHKKMFGVPASWHYFEAGHGKGPCDGLGGTSKRAAQDAVKQGKAIIQDANDYFKWATENKKSINYIFYDKKDYSVASDDVDDMKSECQAIRGTLKLHAVVTSENGLYTRNTSCACPVCLLEEPGINCGWSYFEHKQNTGEHTQENVSNIEDLSGEFVGLAYEGKWYIGKVLSIDKTRKLPVQVTCMVGSGNNTFKWPEPSDQLWLYTEEVLSIIEAPEKKRQKFTISDATKNNLDKLLDTFKDRVTYY